MNNYVSKNWITFAVLALLIALSIISYGGQVTSNPPPVDGNTNILIKPGGMVTFQASSTNGLVSFDQSMCNFVNGSPTYSAAQSTATVQVSFSSDGSGHNNACTLYVDHSLTNAPANTTCTTDAPFTYNVIIPSATFLGISGTLKVGISTSTNNRTQNLTASISPANAVAYTSVQGDSETSITNVSNDLTEGNINFSIVGLTQSSNQGDSTLTVVDSSNDTITTNPVSVIVPGAIQNPNINQTYTVAGYNDALNQNTVPPISDVDSSHFMLCTVYEVPLTVTVLDQFNSSLGALYANASISEYAFSPINESLSSGATYTDNVGRVAPESTTLYTNNAPEISAWKSSSTRAPLQSNNDTQNIPVQVDGHALNPAVVNRQVNATAPNQIQVIWNN